MKLIYRYGPCWILSFPQMFGKKIEFVYAPKKYSIPEHCHPNTHIELCLLFAPDVILIRTDRISHETVKYKANIRSTGKHFTVRASDMHSFHTKRFPFIFMNIETNEQGKDVSAAIDFQVKLTKEEFYAKTK